MFHLAPLAEIFVMTSVYTVSTRAVTAEPTLHCKPQTTSMGTPGSDHNHIRDQDQSAVYGSTLPPRFQIVISDVIFSLLSKNTVTKGN